MKLLAPAFVAVIIPEVVHSWNLLPPRLAKHCATAATCAALLGAPMVATAADDATSFKVDINTPYIIELVKTKEARQGTYDRLNFLYESANNFLGPAVNLELPSDIKGVVKQALSGAATVKINGQEVGVQVVGSTSGALTIQLSNPLLPALPFAGLPTTPVIVNKAADVVADSSPAALELATNIMQRLQQFQEEKPQQEPFFDRPINAETIRIDIDAIDFHRALTPKDIVGSGSLALGATYATSYSYYLYINDKEEKEAAAKKAAVEAKKKAAAAKAATSKRESATSEEKEEAKEATLV
ncbi:hypothetical protein ACA910_012014 [Epithemia clementina (nom. ined.)]